MTGSGVFVAAAPVSTEAPPQISKYATVHAYFVTIPRIAIIVTKYFSMHWGSQDPLCLYARDMYVHIVVSMFLWLSITVLLLAIKQARDIAIYIYIKRYSSFS